MSLQSMTGFARATAADNGTQIVWELRSVNGKALEIRSRLPGGLERLEPAVRQAAQQRFKRGNINATLTVTRPGMQAVPVVNEAFLRDLAGLGKRIEEQFGAAPATSAELLALRGVLDTGETAESDEDREQLDRLVVKTLLTALDSLAEARRSEGEALVGLLRGHVDQIEDLTARAERDQSRTPDAIRHRLAEQVALLMQATGGGLDQDRLHMEAAILATKADIREETDRLRTHIGAARELLSGEGAVGRKLDFIAQEFNRESNTLCSKSNAASVTALGLELKVVVDQFREQVQNLE